MTIYRRRSDAQEALLHLYLRLNGYFVSGLVLHSATYGANAAELDAIAVRHRFQSEPRREMRPSEFLAPKKTDLLICEVKSAKKPEFNEAFRKDEACIREALQWVGLFSPRGAEQMAKRLKPLLQPDAKKWAARAGLWDYPRAIRVRGLLCSPEAQNVGADSPWMLDGSEMFGYIANCLRPEFMRTACSVQYNFEAWGPWLSPLVTYFKQLPGERLGQIDDLYQFLEREGHLPKSRRNAA